jgi:NAD(P)-dependent dehydrogenase (short-subunit alcohol dehydrogenase family)
MDLNLLRNGLAVLTGSASGLGYAMASHCATLQMKVILSDLRPDALKTAVENLRKEHPNTIVEGFVCDVSSPTSVQQLLDQVQSKFPNENIKFLSANAGVFFPKSTILTGTSEEWLTTYKVNVLGLANTLKVFANAMLLQWVQKGVESAIEITASIAGVVNGGTGPYGTSKHASLAIAEALLSEIRNRGAEDKIHITVLCPAIVQTALRQTSLKVANAALATSQSNLGSMDVAMLEARGQDASSMGAVQMFEALWTNGMEPSYCAEEVFNCLENGTFYCILDNTIERDGFTMHVNDVIGLRTASFLTGAKPPQSAKPKL